MRHSGLNELRSTGSSLPAGCMAVWAIMKFSILDYNKILFTLDTTLRHDVVVILTLQINIIRDGKYDEALSATGGCTTQMTPFFKP